LFSSSRRFDVEICDRCHGEGIAFSVSPRRLRLPETSKTDHAFASREARAHLSQLPVLRISPFVQADIFEIFHIAGAILTARFPAPLQLTENISTSGACAVRSARQSPWALRSAAFNQRSGNVGVSGCFRELQ
jgi:hypothetical protein